MRCDTTRGMGALRCAGLSLLAFLLLLPAGLLTQASGQERREPGEFPNTDQASEPSSREEDEEDRQIEQRREQRGDRREERRGDRTQRRQQADRSDENADRNNGDEDGRSMGAWLRERMAQARRELSDRVEELERELTELRDTGQDTAGLEREIQGVREQLSDRDGLLARLRQTWREEQRERVESQIQELNKAAQQAAREGRSEEAAELRSEVARLRSVAASNRPRQAARIQALRNAISSLREAGLDDFAEDATTQLQQWIEDSPTDEEETGEVAASYSEPVESDGQEQQPTSLETTVRDLRTEVQQLRRELDQLRREVQTQASSDSDENPARN